MRNFSVGVVTWGCLLPAIRALSSCHDTEAVARRADASPARSMTQTAWQSWCLCWTIIGCCGLPISPSGREVSREESQTANLSHPFVVSGGDVDDDEEPDRSEQNPGRPSSARSELGLEIRSTSASSTPQIALIAISNSSPDHYACLPAFCNCTEDAAWVRVYAETEHGEWLESPILRVVPGESIGGVARASSTEGDEYYDFRTPLVLVQVFEERRDIGTPHGFGPILISVPSTVTRDKRTGEQHTLTNRERHEEIDRARLWLSENEGKRWTGWIDVSVQREHPPREVR